MEKLILTFPLPPDPDSDPPDDMMTKMVQWQAEQTAVEHDMTAGAVRFIEKGDGLVDEHGEYVCDDNGTPLLMRTARFEVDCEYSPGRPGMTRHATRVLDKDPQGTFNYDQAESACLAPRAHAAVSGSQTPGHREQDPWPA